MPAAAVAFRPPAVPLLAALLLAAVAGDAAGAAGERGRRLGGIAFEPCALTADVVALAVPAQCGSLQVPEDPGRPDGRSLRLAIAWVPSDARRAQPDPVFVIAGGPGQSAVESFALAWPAFREVLRRRHVILVDQRGTGGTAPLPCRERLPVPGPAGSPTDAAAEYRRAAQQCLERARSLDLDPRFFTTSDAVLDLEAVRRAIGAPAVNLVGVSYGTRVALEYLRRYPATTRAVVLNGVVPPQLALGAEHARNLDDSLRRQFAFCRGQPACRERLGDPSRSLETLAARLRAAPLEVAYLDPLTGEPRQGRLDVATLAGVVRLYAYAPQLAAMLPFTLHEALAGRPGTLLAQAGMLDSLVGEQIYLGTQLAVACSEDAPRLRPDPADAGTLMGSGFVDALLAQCAGWPRGRVPADFHAAVRSDRPALLLSGELDPVTPPRYGARVLADLSRGRHLVAPGQGHDVLAAGCMPRLVARFLDRADAAALDAGCLAQLGRTPPFAGPYGWEP